MHRYSLYIMKQLGLATALVTLSLTSIVWLTQALRFIDFIVSRGIAFTSFLQLTLMLIPSLLLFVLPFALLCAVIFVYYRLMMDSELLVLASAGLSRLQIAAPALNVAAIVTILGYILSLYLLPVSYREFKDMQSFLRDNYASLLLQEEVFNSPVEGLTVFIRERDKDNILRGIIVHDSRDENKPPVTMMAEEGKFVQTTQGPRLILYKGNRQEVEKGKLSFLDFDQYTLDISFYTNKGGVRPRQPEEMYLSELLFPGERPDAQRLIAEGHNRITWPISAIALTLLAVSILLTGEFNRRGQWQRVTVAIGIAAVSLSGGIGLLNLASRLPWAILLMYINVLGIIVFAVWLLTYEKSRRDKVRT